MKYTYAYKTSDGVRHEAAMEAASREEVFEALRAKGIRAIKVVAADGSKANGAENGRRTAAIWIAALVSAALLVSAAFVAVAPWRRGGRDVAQPSRLPTQTPPTQPTQPTPAQGRDALRRVAIPLPRQEIQGNRRRLEIAPTNLFETALETYLSRYAEPGREVESAARPQGFADEKSLLAALDAPVYFADDEFTEFVDLKRITAGIKREMADFIRGGDTAGEYYDALDARQRQEAGLRAKAERRLGELTAAGEKGQSKAYDYWLKANAQLRSMGIYPLPLPDALRDYAATLDLDE